MVLVWNQWYKRQIISTFGELSCHSHTGYMVHQLDGGKLHNCSQLALEEYRGISNHTVDLDVLAKSLGKILIAMGNDDKIQMCSVESYGKDTLYGNVHKITLKKAEDAFQEDMLSLQPCYPAQPCSDDYNAILLYAIVY